MPIRNINRTVGTMLSGEIAKRYGHEGLPDDTIHIRFAGSAGQSLRRVPRERRDDRSDRRHQRLLRQRACRAGASRSSLRPSSAASRARTSSPATSCSTAQSPAKRISAASRASALRCATRARDAVVEGVGDHGCEYMTGGTVVGAGHDRAQFRGGHVGRHRLRARRRRHVPPAAATRRWSISSRC